MVRLLSPRKAGRQEVKVQARVRTLKEEEKEQARVKTRKVKARRGLPLQDARRMSASLGLRQEPAFEETLALSYILRGRR